MSSVSNVRTGETAPSVEPVAPKSRLVNNDPNRVQYATDTRGRRIGVHVIDALDMFELTLLLGPEQGNNGSALNQALIFSSVVSIDDREVTRPLSLLALKARIKEVGFDGLAAASKALEALGGTKEEPNVDALKN